MNTEIAGETIATNLSLKTYEKLFQKMDGSDNPLTPAKEWVARHFESLLDYHFNQDESINSNQFINNNSIIAGVIYEQAKTEDEREELLSELCNLYYDSFIKGYIAAMKDGEPFFEYLTTGSESKTKSPASAPTLTGQALKPTTEIGLD